MNEGCILIKMLFYLVKIYDGVKYVLKYVVMVLEVFFDFFKIIVCKLKVVCKLVLGVKLKLMFNNVIIISGEVIILDKNMVCCGEEIYECDNLIFCIGFEIFIFFIFGIDSVNYWIYCEVLDNKELLVLFVIVGGGVIGMEFVFFFNSLGVKVIVIEMMDEILGGMDKEFFVLLCVDYVKWGI